MIDYEQRLKSLCEIGMYYANTHKICLGKVQVCDEFGNLNTGINTCGYYQNTDDTWVVFVTDDERGVEIERYRYDSEERAISELIELVEYNNFVHMRNQAKNEIESKKRFIVDYLISKYGYSEIKAEKAYSYLLQNKTIAFEFVYYLEHLEFVPDKYAAKYSEYTVKKLSEREDLTLLGAFNYMVYLKKNPTEALANLKKGLPRRKIYSETELKEVQGKMDEKITTPVEEIAEPQKTPAETPAEQTALLEKLDAVQQALATLQQSFDDKIAEDTHKNGLFDNMHRELVRYQNGVLDKIVDTIALDIIQLVDSTKGHVRVYEKKEPTEENYKKLLRIVKGIAEDLEDILYRQNIESYRVPGHEVDTRRQKIIQTVPTDDKSKDNLIAVRAADGYEKGDKVLRPERIKIFKYEAPATKPTENN